MTLLLIYSIHALGYKAQLNIIVGEIPEGYLDVILPGGRPSQILHPANPGSVYHLTKCLDALLFQYYNKNDGVRVTDLHQGEYIYIPSLFLSICQQIYQLGSDSCDRSQ
jgi:nucleoside-diphosphate-sugar epimerase